MKNGVAIWTGTGRMRGKGLFDGFEALGARWAGGSPELAVTIGEPCTMGRGAYAPGSPDFRYVQEDAQSGNRDYSEISGEREVQLKNGMQPSLTLIGGFNIDGKPTTQVGLIGEVPIGGRFSPVPRFLAKRAENGGAKRPSSENGAQEEE